MRQKMLERADHIHRGTAETLDWINSWLGTVKQWEQKTTLHHTNFG